MRKFLSLLGHIFITLLLTVVTQVGGVVYVIAVLFVKHTATRQRLKRAGLFAFLYLLVTFFVVPPLASALGRERIKESQAVSAHSFFYRLANRNYVTPALNDVIEKTAQDFRRKYPTVTLVYLDANFPFIDGFPLLPHLSHNDGKKLDVTFVYKDPSGKVTNLKPAISGYGVYEAPENSEINQPATCINGGYWQYDFPKYLTFGTINNDFTISEEGTRALSLSFLKQSDLSKLFIEPHLKERLGLYSNKVRFHGCQAVRHDDHIHVQVK